MKLVLEFAETCTHKDANGDWDCHADVVTKCSYCGAAVCRAHQDRTCCSQQRALKEVLEG